MENKSKFRLFWFFSLLVTVLASFYPLIMGINVITDMLFDKMVLKENYPKYIIPYTPIALSVIMGVLLLPLFMKVFKKGAVWAGALLSSAVFFVSELLLEQNVVIATAEKAEGLVNLEDWQMYMCAYTGAILPIETKYRVQTPVDILMGNYTPAFKLHFYVISVVLILSLLNCFYGFGKIALSGSKEKLNALILQSVTSIGFLGLCILACFTAFWRDGSLEVSPLSAFLMTVFFILAGTVGGIFTGSFLLGKAKLISIGVPVLVSIGLTALMYASEMILLSGNLYIFGKGFLFEPLPKIVLSLFDIAIVIFSGIFTALTFKLLNREKNL